MVIVCAVSLYICSNILFLFFSALNNGEDTSLVEIQTLLLKGERNDAVKAAMAGKHFALALLISSVCDHSTYYSVAKSFVDTALPSDTPLHTVAALFANQNLGDDGVTDEFWKKSTGHLDESWRHHLASILNNQTQGWKKIVISLGDQLRESGKYHAAHFCYLVSGCPITSCDDPSSRLVLVGCDHGHKVNRLLSTSESVEAYERTEALEWAKRKGNQNAVISSLQPFKLQYASLLADNGFERASKLYLDSIRKCTGIQNANEFEFSSKLPYSVDFAKALDVLEDRLCLSMAIENESQKKSKNKMSVPSVLSKFRQRKEAEVKVDDTATDDLCIEDDTNASFLSAKSNILDITANAINVAHNNNNAPPAARTVPPQQPPMDEAMNDLTPSFPPYNEGSSKSSTMQPTEERKASSDMTFPSQKDLTMTPHRQAPNNHNSATPVPMKSLSSYNTPTSNPNKTTSGTSPNSAPTKSLRKSKAAVPMSAPRSPPTAKKEEAPNSGM
jgi:hypothetical protein